MEVQQTFYQPPQPATAARWRAQAPQEFEFTVKAWQLITHPPTSPTYRRLKTPLGPGAEKLYGFFRPTDAVLKAWETTWRIARELQARVVLLQTPTSFRPIEEHVDNLRRFAGKIDRHGLTLVWEPRGPWPEEVVVALCRELDLVHGVDPFRQQPLAGSLSYFRLHGRNGYHYRYTFEELVTLYEICRQPGPQPVYCLFNNAHMLEDARNFLELSGLR